jgi:hypothetical protein
MSVEAEDMLNEVEVWIDRTIAAQQHIRDSDADIVRLQYLKGINDGLRMVKGAVEHMREEL